LERAGRDFPAQSAAGKNLPARSMSIVDEMIRRGRVQDP
jgi:hypothetical protein